jgi:hypothetical protein
MFLEETQGHVLLASQVSHCQAQALGTFGLCPLLDVAEA